VEAIVAAATRSLEIDVVELGANGGGNSDPAQEGGRSLRLSQARNTELNMEKRAWSPTAIPRFFSFTLCLRP